MSSSVPLLAELMMDGSLVTLTECDPGIVSEEIQEKIVGDDGDTRRSDVHSGHVEHYRSVRVVVLEVIHCHDEAENKCLSEVFLITMCLPKLLTPIDHLKYL